MIEQFVKELLTPVYKYVGVGAPFIIGIIVIFLCFWILSKIRSWIKSKLTKKFQIGSTNSWFSWEKYYAYKGEIEERKKGKN